MSEQTDSGTGIASVAPDSCTPYFILHTPRSVLGILFQPKSNNASLFLHAKICARLLNGFPLSVMAKEQGKGMQGEGWGDVSYRRQEQGQ